MNRISKTLSITLPPEYSKRLNEQQKQQQRTASEIIREALRAYYGIGAVKALNSRTRRKVRKAN